VYGGWWKAATFQVAVEFLIGSVVGWLVARLRRQTRLAERRAIEAEGLRDELGRRADLLDAVSRFYKGLLLMGWPVSVGIFVLAHPLTPLLLGHGFLASEPALRVLALALGIAFVNNAFIGALNASDRQSSFTWAAGWSVVANLALNLVLIPLFGYQGASWATVMTELVLGVAGWILTSRYVGHVPVLQLSWRVVLAGVIMGAAIYPLSTFEGFKVAIPIVSGAVVYAGFVLLLRALNREEIGWARRALALAR